ncbi:MAG: hypothetical protein J6Y08_05355 [Clostridiales bacterium]|nr:hypothetical protein [Clostridiales bacterium]
MAQVDLGKTNWSQSVGGVCIQDETVPDLTKKMIRCAVKGEGFELVPYESKTPGRNLYQSR